MNDSLLDHHYTNSQSEFTVFHRATHPNMQHHSFSMNGHRGLNRGLNLLHSLCLHQVGTRPLEVSEEEPGAVMELSNPALNVLTKQRTAGTPPAILADSASCSGLQVAGRAAGSWTGCAEATLSVDLKTRAVG